MNWWIDENGIKRTDTTPRANAPSAVTTIQFNDHRLTVTPHNTRAVLTKSGIKLVEKDSTDDSIND